MDIVELQEVNVKLVVEVLVVLGIKHQELEVQELHIQVELEAAQDIRAPGLDKMDLTKVELEEMA
jgi:hypothetical protein